jgi:hypothetical protein
MPLFSGSPSRNLSGLNTSASSPQIFLSLKILKAQYPMEVPPGMNIPLISSPPGGTSFAMSYNWRPDAKSFFDDCLEVG